ncbi:hypothetical protein R3P38DRAFT_2785765 [Favolaschia claudopus]|uniref:Uncharacterized protein n=1 Tax=Favolaschia claudopus TaxID=2862362 RepID=A0AAW0ATY2_9AGAR
MNAVRSESIPEIYKAFGVARNNKNWGAESDPEYNRNWITFCAPLRAAQKAHPKRTRKQCFLAVLQQAGSTTAARLQHAGRTCHQNIQKLRETKSDTYLSRRAIYSKDIVRIHPPQTYPRPRAPYLPRQPTLSVSTTATVDDDEADAGDITGLPLLSTPPPAPSTLTNAWPARVHFGTAEIMLIDDRRCKVFVCATAVEEKARVEGCERQGKSVLSLFLSWLLPLVFPRPDSRFILPANNAAKSISGFGFGLDSAFDTSLTFDPALLVVGRKVVSGALSVSESMSSL